MSDIFIGLGTEPLDAAPGIIALIVGLIIWQRHRADRRARVFLALGASELAFGIPLLISATALPRHPIGVAAVDGFVLATGLVSATIFLHFGMSFPHARPWLRRGNINVLYLAAVLVGLTPVAAAAIGPRVQASVQDALDGTLIGVGLLVLVASGVACVSIYRSYREMTADQRRRYRAPVLGVLAGMVAGIAVDLLLGLMFAFVAGGDRYKLWTANLLATAAGLLLPLFFFMAAVKYRLLERHSQDYQVNLGN
ncbi:MAG: hypothetical protein WD690_04765 [Vicinamibacterales bacterium]